ncbi:NotI family restriction endonuclease [Desulfofundulus sp.]|uniref:NotI family restriction endonuclease n=1 Tax=Desulfofundulus sp. TaxID=2282750 RepID=UPI003C79364F
MSDQPLAEVFGFPIDNLSDEAEYYRKNRLCPYNNKIPSCTKDKANDPLGVCSVFEGDKIAITCPTRFNQNWLALGEAARFFFNPDSKWTALREVPLKDRNGRNAGNIDFVLVRVDDENKILDFGSVEVQAVYISGNVRKPFEYYMSDRVGRKNMIWKSTNVRPDYLSSSRKRLAPQLIYKGGILKAWGEKASGSSA